MSITRTALWTIICFSGLLTNNVNASNLMSIYHEALQHDTQYAIALTQKRVGNEQYVQGRAGLLPQLVMDSQTSWSDTQYEVVGGSVEHRRQNRNYGIQLVQPVFRWKNWIEFQQGDLQKAVADVRLQKTRQEMIVRVAEAYFAALNSEDVYRSISELRNADSEQLASARKNFELGNVTSADVHEAQASFDRATAQLIKAKNDRIIAYQGLARITGKQVISLSALADPVTLTPPQPDTVDEWLAVAAEGNLDIQAQRILLDIATHEIGRQKADHLPTVDFFVSQNMQQNPSASTERSDSSSIGLRLSMPLYSGGRTSSAVREALAMQSQAEHELEDARRAATSAIWDTWSSVMTGIAQVQALEAAKKSAQLAVNANRMGYNVGVRVSIDVLEVQSQLSETVQQLSRARYDTLLAQLKLKAAVGDLQENDLANINNLLQD